MLLKKNAEKNDKAMISSYLGKLMLLIGIGLMLTTGIFAQVGGGGDEDPDQVPFDGGISILVAAGVAYGAKQWRDSKKSGKEKSGSELEG